ncbi:DUF262 domain-containing protein [Bacillus cereus group sp. N18]|uniref:DUF262 domain-containing protein n=1 Tax=unclassified Bacillus cereus group TaxID=2750818 RepID=UPI000893431F|nr:MULTISPECIES: DUF262 domain-containing protein [unclassified Bacillus cereus group]OFC92754.1 hypothetical protein BTGOE5_53780 [Bacillus thuringiensis]HDR7323220.1 DUF262 domain-containing protein [Bacillus toyonensis]MBJ8050162.1 DUF262 domain-containing protein [Bacillus cereus group sp. N18]OFD01776.1 hypothetical protein BTGOE7_55450 [Bacillus thuringiensis]HDR7440462.1 DUF262 domain-containing protein [Bacillus toyonensis]
MTDGYNDEILLEGAQEEEEGSDLSYLSEEERNVVIERVQYSIFELYRKYRRGDIILDPFYQRNSVWQIPKRSKLIESVIRNIPVPSIYLAEQEDGCWEVVDGQQRLRSFFDFLEGKYKLTGLPVLGKMKNKYFDDLEAVYQRKLEDYQLHIFIIKKNSHQDIRFDIFERINEGATQLNAQELRNSMYREGQINFLITLSKDRYFKALITGKLQSINRLKDQEAVLRFLSFYLKGFEAYNGNLNSFLNDTLDNFDIYIESPENIQRHFSQTMKTILDVLGSDAFIKNGSRVMNMSLFDVITFSFAKVSHGELIKHRKKIQELHLYLINEDQEFKKSITTNTLSKKTVEYRFETWMTMLQDVLGGNE